MDWLSKLLNVFEEGASLAAQYLQDIVLLAFRPAQIVRRFSDIEQTQYRPIAFAAFSFSIGYLCLRLAPSETQLSSLTLGSTVQALGDIAENDRSYLIRLLPLLLTTLLLSKLAVRIARWATLKESMVSTSFILAMSYGFLIVSASTLVAHALPRLEGDIGLSALAIRFLELLTIAVPVIIIAATVTFRIILKGAIKNTFYVNQTFALKRAFAIAVLWPVSITSPFAAIAAIEHVAYDLGDSRPYLDANVVKASTAFGGYLGYSMGATDITLLIRNPDSRDYYILPQSILLYINSGDSNPDGYCRLDRGCLMLKEASTIPIKISGNGSAALSFNIVNENEQGESSGTPSLFFTAVDSSGCYYDYLIGKQSKFVVATDGSDLKRGSACGRFTDVPPPEHIFEAISASKSLRTRAEIKQAKQAQDPFWERLHNVCSNQTRQPQKRSLSPTDNKSEVEVFFPEDRHEPIKFTFGNSPTSEEQLDSILRKIRKPIIALFYVRDGQLARPFLSIFSQWAIKSESSSEFVMVDMDIIASGPNYKKTNEKFAIASVPVLRLYKDGKIAGELNGIHNQCELDEWAAAGFPLVRGSHRIE